MSDQSDFVRSILRINQSLTDQLLRNQSCGSIASQSIFQINPNGEILRKNHIKFDHEVVDQSKTD